MHVVQIVAVSILGAFLSLVLKEYKPFLGVAISVVTVSFILFSTLPDLEYIVSYARRLCGLVGEEEPYLSNVLKITGIACLTWLGSDILKDAGLSAASSAIIVTGKVICMGLCMPIISALFETLLFILPG